MDIETKVRKRYRIKLDEKELATLVHMLVQYDRNVAQKLPDGTPGNESRMIRELFHLHRGMPYDMERTPYVG
jgi:hypothetical protein